MTAPNEPSALAARGPGFRSAACRIAVIAGACLLVLLGDARGFCRAAARLEAGEGVHIIYPDGMQGAAREVASAFAAGRKQLEAVLGWGVDFTPRIVLVDETRRFAQWARCRQIVAFAVPSQTLIVIDWDRLGSRPVRLQRVLRHELCHLQLHRHIGRESLPRWLDEGVAQWASGGFSELIARGAPIELDRAMLGGDWLPLAELNANFPRDFHRLRLAYAESLSAVAYIVRTYKREGLLRLLRCLEQGEAVDKAFRRSLGLSSVKFEQDWKAYLAHRTTWLTVAATHIYEIVFTLAALLAVAGGVRRALRKRARLSGDSD